MKLLSRQSRALPGVTGVARVSRRSDALLGRVGHKDIVVIDHVDIDRATADALVKAGVTAVVNAAPSISGRYPEPRPGDPGRLRRHPDRRRRREDLRQAQGRRQDPHRRRRRSTSARSRSPQGIEQTPESVADLMIEAKTGMSAQLEAFAANAIEYMKRERTLLLDGVGIPEISTDLAGPAGAAGRGIGRHQGAAQVAEEVHLRLPAGAGRRRRRRRRAAGRRVQAAR